MRLNTASYIIIFLLLTSCQSNYFKDRQVNELSPKNQDWQTFVENQQDVDNWHMSGQFSIVIDNITIKTASVLSFNWGGNFSSSTIEIHDQGHSLALIKIEDSHPSLISSSVVIDGINWDDIIDNFPFEYLSYWLFAIPKYEEEYRAWKDNLEYPSIIIQNGYNIIYNEYRLNSSENTSDLILPRKIRIIKDSSTISFFIAEFIVS